MNTTLTQIPQPMHSCSEMSADLEFGPTSMQCFPAQETNHKIRQDPIPGHKILNLFSVFIDQIKRSNNP